MEVLTIDGLEYVKAAHAARAFSYTTDYVGQLCRTKKVTAKLVGRTWYVNLDSLTSHKQQRVEARSNEKSIKSYQNTTVSRVAVNAQPRSSTHKSIAYATQKQSRYLSRINWKAANYETDAEDLIPSLTKDAVEASKPLKVSLAGAEAVPITRMTKPTALEPDGLPEISLQGKLRVISAELDYGDQYEANSKDISDVQIDVDQEAEPVQSRVMASGLTKAVTTRTLPMGQVAPTMQQEISLKHSLTFAPRAVVEQQRVHAVAAQGTRRSLLWYLILCLCLVLLCYTLALFLFQCSVAIIPGDTIHQSCSVDPLFPGLLP